MTTMNRQELAFRVINSPEDLFGLADSWELLWSSIPGAAPFCAPKWIFCWFTTFWKAEWKLSVLAGFHGEKLCVLVPIYIQPSKSLSESTFAFPLGQGEDEIEEICSEYLEILIAPGFEESTRKPVAEWIQNLAVDGIRWRGVRSEDFTAPLIQSIRGARTSFDRRYVIDKDSWHMDKLGRNAVNKWKRIHNRLQKNDSKFEWVFNSDQEDLWRSLAEHHQRRWTAKGHAGAFFSSRFLDFHQMYQRETKYENSCMSCLRINGEPIAINYYFIDQDTLYFYQSGWDPGFANLSPGFALHIWSIEHSDRRFYDFMIGAATNTYKKAFKCSDTEITNFEIIFSPIRFWIGNVCRKLLRVTRKVGG